MKMCVTAAAMLYEQASVSQSKAAELAGVSCQEFIEALSELRVPATQETLDEIRAGLGDSKQE